LAAADLNGDGKIEVVATTTQTQSAGTQVFVFSSNGALFQPAGVTYPAWPRYNTRAGVGGDGDHKWSRASRYGCYGLNVGIGNIDDDPQLEIIVTYDNHTIEAFKMDGQSINASPWFTKSGFRLSGNASCLGQFIRWADPDVEENHYHLHTGLWPNPGTGQEWLQWTASPPNVVDLNHDGHNVVVAIPNVEKNIPYQTKAYAVYGA